MAGVYISYPFCRQKCTYCNFASGVWSPGLEHDYLAALLSEIRRRRWEWAPETIYLGGGSPDLMQPGDVRRVLSATPGCPWKEATIEVAPGDVTLEKVECWIDCGINRVSLGVQSFVEEEIRRTGRRHTAEIVGNDVALLAGAGIAKINIDLIAGLPGQTRESWRESLEWVKRLGVGHVSVYMLEVDEHSRLGRELLSEGSRYGAGAVPGEDLIAEFYETAVEWLAGLGIERYEISNFARPGEESVHNLKYWKFEPYVGFGAGAHSCDPDIRSENVDTAAEYVERWRVDAGFRAAETPVRRSSERFYVGLRLAEGIVLTPEELTKYKEPIERFVFGDYLEKDGDRLRLTPRGILLSNEVFQEFV